MLSSRERILGGLWGAVVGDALGVPVEFQPRNELRRDPVTDMRGNGTYGQPPATWSDDSSLLLCTVEALLQGFDTGRLGHLFVRWLTQAYWTPWGKVFDVGITTQRAIRRVAQGVPPEEAGLDDDASNGNGSLMRILPVGLRFAGSSVERLLEYAHRASALTHRHLRSQMACGSYCLLVVALLKGADPVEAYRQTVEAVNHHYGQPPYAVEFLHFERFLSGHLGSLSEEAIRSTGYVIHTLEASIWCLLNTKSFGEAVLRAVNLGDDTDTTATVTGGLAGIHYGEEAVPLRWRGQLARKDELDGLFEAFVSACQPPGVEAG